MFSIWKRKAKNERTENRITSFMLHMAVSYSIFLLITLSILFWQYQTQLQNSTNSYWMQTKSIFQTSVDLLSNQLSIMDSFARQFTQDSNFYQLVNYTTTEHPRYYFTAMKAKSNFSAQLYASTSLPIDTYFIYLRNTDYILSVQLFEQSELYFSGKRKFQPEYYSEWLVRLKDTDHSGSVYSMDNYNTGTNSRFLMYVIDMDSVSYRNIPATVCFELELSKLLDTFGGLTLNDNSFVYITDQDGSRVMELDENAQEHSLSPSLLASLEFTDDIAQYQAEDGTLMHVIRLDGSAQDWIYYLIQPNALGMNNFPMATYAVFLASAVIFGVILIAAMVIRNTKPLRVMNAELKTVTTDRNQLQEEMEEQKPLLREAYLRRLFNGSVNTEEELRYIREFLQYPESGVLYYVLYAVAYNNEATEDSLRTFTPPGQQENARTALIRDSLLEYLLHELPLHLYPIDAHTCAVLIAAPEGEDPILRIQERVLALHNFLLEQHSIWLYIGMGSGAPSLMNLWESYQQARDAINYSTKNYIFLPYELITKDSSRYYYPRELSEKLSNFITTGNCSQIIELFNLIHEENIEQRALPLNLLKFLLSDIRNTLLKTRFLLPAELDSSLREIDEQLNTRLSFRQYEELALAISQFFTRKSESEDIITLIEAYIRENYQDPSICLSQISDKFQISESYFSHLFKERVGVNFSVYLENIRLTSACQRIKEGGCNLSELYLLVGYNNPSSFRRAFKKKYGVPPSAYQA